MMVTVLFEAIKYQDKYWGQNQSDQLIALSLICWRSCLEALRVRYRINLDEQPKHSRCTSRNCEIVCIEQVNSSISLYSKELSRVFFSKESMRNRKPWWLSAFYSFYIQSFVRKALIVLGEDFCPARHSVKQYQQLQVRLFIASMGTYDPISEPDPDLSGAIAREFESARLAVRKATWADSGIRSSADYLKMLYEDDGEPMDPQGNPLLITRTSALENMSTCED
ncbi:hypothetical protein ONS95_008288 [Cadophora gregata]|uniref:uncharacterized protein n=1 Tax=Cadophora gregata TaxID=51156 RepID=UPI0026DAD602|nr:uncharacterized protein ONS95_008288 [Cadophora gregata]KAK0100330.1 hypothetical protein ONS96_007610 [Cadophora gregata f. sp. sojae]KAK0126707.1 hypothetical protein ONS95_008288 [Cadophora gregata]